jgi:hypothetical protein
MKPKRIAIEDIHRDMLLQPRAELHKDWIEDYAMDMVAGAKFPPVVVFFDGLRHWLADGFHRMYAAEACGMKSLLADVRDGKRRDALLFSLSVNSEHGHRRTNEDKQRAVDIMLADREWSKMSDNKIAEQCSVGQPMVSRRRKAMASYSENKMETRTVTRDGTTYEMDTSNIGSSDSRAAIENTVEAEASAAKGDVEPFDWEAAKLRNTAMEAIRALATQPPVDDVIAAWNKSNSYGEPMETLEKAHAWLGNFVNRYRVVEPQRWARVQGGLANAAE